MSEKKKGLWDLRDLVKTTHEFLTNAGLGIKPLTEIEKDAKKEIIKQEKEVFFTEDEVNRINMRYDKEDFECKIVNGNIYILAKEDYLKRNKMFFTMANKKQAVE